MVTIGKATLADEETLFDLMQKQFIEHEIDYSSNSLRAAIEEMLRRKGLGFFLVARENGRVIGLAAISFAWTLEHGGKSAWLDELYVLPEDRGRGAGSLLLERAIEEMRKEGCAAVDLEVEEKQRRAETLYRRKGFEPLARSRWVKQLA